MASDETSGVSSTGRAPVTNREMGFEAPPCALQAALNAVPGTDLLSTKVRALLRGYDARWHREGWVTLSVEEEYELPLLNPETARPSLTFSHAGKFDGRIARDGKLYLLEHKSTSDEISDPNSPYWQQLVLDSQVSGYTLASWQQGLKVEGVLYDVIKKPGIKPRKITKAEQKVLAETGEYCGYKVTHRSDFANCTEEDFPLYEMRLTRDVIDDPDRFYRRQTITRLEQELFDHAADLWDIGKTILDARNHKRHYRNSDSCMKYGSPCRFLGVCSGYDNFDSGKWHRAKSVHSELPILEADERGGRDTITTSRAKCFQTCRRKHLYQYEEGWRRNDAEDSEALQFGTLLHKGLEAWWLHFKDPTYEHTPPTQATSATDSEGSEGLPF